MTFTGGTLTTNSLSFSAVASGSVYLSGTTLGQVTSGSLSLTMSNFLTSGAAVTGTMSLKTNTASPSGPINNATYDFNP